MVQLPKVRDLEPALERRDVSVDAVQSEGLYQRRLKHQEKEKALDLSGTMPRSTTS